MAGSSPRSLKISSKDWLEIWRAGMFLFCSFGGCKSIGPALVQCQKSMLCYTQNTGFGAFREIA